MKYLFFNQLLLGVLMTGSVVASDKTGNGGDVVVCPGMKTVMLDTISAKNDGLDARFSENNQTIRDYVNEMLVRQSSKDEIIGRTLRKNATELLEDIEAYLSNGNQFQKFSAFIVGELPNVADEGATYIPVNCKIVQFIIQTVNPLPNQKKYTVRKDLLEEMSNEEIAKGILHEALWGYYLRENHFNSPSVRWYNGMLFSDQISALSDYDLATKMVNFQFPFYWESLVPSSCSGPNEGKLARYLDTITKDSYTGYIKDNREINCALPHVTITSARDYGAQYSIYFERHFKGLKFNAFELRPGTQLNNQNIDFGNVYFTIMDKSLYFNPELFYPIEGLNHLKVKDGKIQSFITFTNLSYFSKKDSAFMKSVILSHEISLLTSGGPISRVEMSSKTFNTYKKQFEQGDIYVLNGITVTREDDHFVLGSGYGMGQLYTKNTLFGEKVKYRYSNDHLIVPKEFFPRLP